MAIDQRTRANQEKLSAARGRLADEDPTFCVGTDADTGQTLVAGGGEGHLEIIRENLSLDHGMEASTGQPRIAYREIVTRAAKGRGERVRQSGDSGQSAKVTVHVAPRARSSGNSFEEKIVGDVILRQFRAAYRRGVEESLMAVCSEVPGRGRRGRDHRRPGPREGQQRVGVPFGGDSYRP